MLKREMRKRAGLTKKPLLGPVTSLWLRNRFEDIASGSMQIRIRRNVSYSVLLVVNEL